MIKKETIYQATNGEYHKSFKIRPDERTGSAHLKQVGQGTEQHWVATDFGDDGLPKNCFDWVIKERNLQGFKEAVAWIVTELNLDVDDIKPERNKPLKIEKVPTEAPEGTVLYELRDNDTFTKRELEVFGELVTQEVMESLNWHPHIHATTIPSTHANASAESRVTTSRRSTRFINRWSSTRLTASWLQESANAVTLTVSTNCERRTVSSRDSRNRNSTVTPPTRERLSSTSVSRLP